MSFLQQLRNLHRTTPKIALHLHPTCINSEYGNFNSSTKNCYLCFETDFSEDSHYIYVSEHARDSLDLAFCMHLELCYECVDCEHCYNCYYCQNSHHCRDSEFLYECRSCENCFGCVNLFHKKYHIYNRSYSKKKYQKQLAEIKKQTAESGKKPTEFHQKKLTELRKKTPHLASHVVKSENCFGDFIYHSKNCFNSFDIYNCEDCANVYEQVVGCKDTFDSTHALNSELSYELISIDKAYHCHNCFFCLNINDCEFCESIFNCEHCFGCNYLRSKKYHILNQPYSPEDYEKKVAEIKTELKSKGLYGQNLLVSIRN